MGHPEKIIFHPKWPPGEGGMRRHNFEYYRATPILTITVCNYQILHNFWKARNLWKLYIFQKLRKNWELTKAWKLRTYWKSHNFWKLRNFWKLCNFQKSSNFQKLCIFPKMSNIWQLVIFWKLRDFYTLHMASSPEITQFQELQNSRKKYFLEKNWETFQLKRVGMYTWGGKIFWNWENCAKIAQNCGNCAKKIAQTLGVEGSPHENRGWVVQFQAKPLFWAQHVVRIPKTFLFFNCDDFFKKIYNFLI